MQILVKPDPSEAATAAAAQISDALAAAPAGGALAVSLCGGSSPIPLYTKWGEGAYPLPWDRIDWYLGDERHVPHDDEASNFGMARRLLFDPAQVAATRRHPVPYDESGAPSAARRYEAELRALAERRGKERGLFDVTLLGLGDDGHTASLFPGHEALDESERWVTSVVGAKPRDRITLTYGALAMSQTILFLVTGASKSAIVRRVLVDRDPSLPATHVQAIGSIHWILDAAAAADLPDSLIEDAS